MDTTKYLTVEDVQGYLSKGVVPLPFIYERMLEQLEQLQQEHRVSMLPVAIFDVYHLRLKKKLIWRIEQHQARKSKRKAA
jgi:hypothetical protein